MVNVSLSCAVVMPRAARDRRAGVPRSVFDGRMGEVLGGRVGEVLGGRVGEDIGGRVGGDHRAPARADRVEPQRAAHRRHRPAAAARGRGAGATAARHVRRAAVRRGVGQPAAARPAHRGAGRPDRDRRRRRPRRDRLRRLRGPHDGGDQRGAGPRVVGLAGRHGARRRHPARRSPPSAARVDRVLDRARARLAPTATSPSSRTGTCCGCWPPAGWGWRREAGALFALPAGSYGVLGHEHARPVLTGWGAPLTDTRSTGCQRLLGLLDRPVRAARGGRTASPARGRRPSAVTSSASSLGLDPLGDDDRAADGGRDR